MATFALLCLLSLVARYEQGPWASRRWLVGAVPAQARASHSEGVNCVETVASYVGVVEMNILFK